MTKSGLILLGILTHEITQLFFKRFCNSSKVQMICLIEVSTSLIIYSLFSAFFSQIYLKEINGCVVDIMEPIFNSTT